MKPGDACVAGFFQAGGEPDAATAGAAAAQGKCRLAVASFANPVGRCVLARRRRRAAMPVRAGSGAACIVGSTRRGFAPSEQSEKNMSTASHAVAQESKVRTVFRVVSGNFLEMYDFMVYGYYASAIAKTYFPSGNAFASLMLSL
ncbi:citrate-proton symporter, partial [Burkholderia sp. TJI49]